MKHIINISKKTCELSKLNIREVNCSFGLFNIKFIDNKYKSKF